MTQTIRKCLLGGLAGLWLAANAQARAPQGVEHIHGIAFDTRTDAVLLGTHRGVLRLQRDGSARRISDNADDYMAFVPDPSVAQGFLASGHPAGGGNLGLIRSSDNGASWQKLSDGLDGPVDFHQLAVSPVDGQRIYGDFHGLQVSDDAGKSWRRTGKLPDKAFNLVASSVDRDTLFAPTETGLLVSRDAGMSWRPMSMLRLPATVVATANQGKDVYAFLVGQGFSHASEQVPRFEKRSDPFGSRVPLKLVVDPRKTEHLLALDNANSLWESNDGGRSWAYFIQRPRPLSEQATRGQKLFAEYCSSCHGAEANGETWSVQRLRQQDYIAAPALDGSAHAWHHTDEQLVETILNGSPRKSRMPAWKTLLDEQNARDVIAFFKSYWGKRELDCQGPKHMQCM